MAVTPTTSSASVFRAALLVASVVALLGGCDKLGNPPRRYATAATVTRAFGLELVTRTDSVSSYRAAELVAAHPGRSVLGEAAPRSSDTIATLVQISPSTPRNERVRGRVAVTTTFRFANGAATARTFYPDLSGVPWLALFYLPQPPASAVTTFAR